MIRVIERISLAAADVLTRLLVDPYFDPESTNPGRSLQNSPICLLRLCPSDPPRLLSVLRCCRPTASYLDEQPASQWTRPDVSAVLSVSLAQKLALEVTRL